MPENGVNEGRDVIYIPDEEGNEEPFEILFTFERDETGEKYMLVVPEGEADSEGEGEVYAFRYEEDEDDNLTLYLIEDESEWDMVEETFNTLVGGQEEDPGEDV